MNETDLNNFKIIEKIVDNAFYLEPNSLRRFNKLIHDPKYDKTLVDVVGSDLRKRIDIDYSNIDSLSMYDYGWKLFRKNLYHLIDHYEISYNDFLDGHFIYKKNIWKLTKLAIKLYSSYNDLAKNEIQYNLYPYLLPSEKDKIDALCNEHKNKKALEYSLTRFISHCFSKKFKKSIQLVLSLNFADWFLCSTAESWTSCLDLESDFGGCYWAGLAGTIIDKNRALVYLTDGDKKNYLDIETDKFLSRSWCILDSEDVLNIIRFYPEEMLDIIKIKELLENNTGIKVNYSPPKKSKNKLDLLYHENGDSCFLYQDKTTFYKGFICGSGNGGYYVINNGSILTREVFSYCGGLKNLLKSNESLKSYALDGMEECVHCSERLRIDNIDDYVLIDGCYYCNDCFNDNFCYCSSCVEIVGIDQTINVNDELICESCLEVDYSRCDNCGEYENNNFIFQISDGNLYCRNCYNEFCADCEKCGEAFLKSNLNDKGCCENCAKKNVAA